MPGTSEVGGVNATDNLSCLLVAVALAVIGLAVAIEWEQERRKGRRRQRGKRTRLDDEIEQILREVG